MNPMLHAAIVTAKRALKFNLMALLATFALGTVLVVKAQTVDRQKAEVQSTWHGETRH